MTEQNQTQNQIQNLFFSKDTISGFNKIIHQDQTLHNLSREGKQEIIDLLIKNMKSIYKNIDLSKINQTNYPSIFDQFKKISISQTINDIKKNNIVSNFQQSSSELKLQRDFNSNPNKGNLLMDRPENPRNKQQIIQPKQPTKLNQQSNLFQGVSADMGNYDSNLDVAFRPIVNNSSEQNAFNNYNTGKISDDVKVRMKSIQESRETELNMREQRPTTPDFLKPKKTSTRQDDERSNMSQNNTVNNYSNNNVVPDFKNVNPSQFNSDFNGLSNDADDNLFSLDNIDRPLIETEIIEDTLSFEDRLKKLQSDRNIISQSSNQQTNQPAKIDFTDPNISLTQNTNNIQQQSPPREQQQQQNQQREQQLRDQQQQQLREQNQQREQQLRDQQQREQQQQQLREQNQQREQQQLRDQQQLLEQRQQSRSHANKLNDLKSSMRSVNIDFKEDTQKLKILQNKYDELEKMNESLQNELLEFKKTNSLDKINELKQQIAIEFEELNNKGEDIENKIKSLDTKKIEIEQKLINFNLREMEINKIESNIKDMLIKHDNLFKSQHLQLEVSNIENLSSYTWSMEPIKNVTGIKLATYSLPVPRFNIEENKNNILSFTFNDEVKSVILNTGKYTIDELISSLDEKIKIINENLSINVNKEQKIIFESSISTDKINIITTLLSKDNLGFINDTNNALNKQTHISENIWDLRIDNKVYLYLNNLSNDIPFGILYFNGESISQFKFQDPFNLNNLEIIFKDSKGLIYNFYNLPHSLTFIIEKIN